MSIDPLIRFSTDGHVTLMIAHVEIGQGILTAVAQIAADELDINFTRILVERADAERTPIASYTSGSNSIQIIGSAFRQAAADARHLLLAKAAAALQAPVESLRLTDGTITDGEKETTYWALQGDQLFGETELGVGQPKSSEEYTLVGQPIPRLDLPAKIAGTPSFVHDLCLPDMVHGRVIRPPTYASTLESIDENTAASLPGVIAVVRDGSFLGVLAEREEQAEKAAEALRQNARWHVQPLPAYESLYTDLLAKTSQDFLVVDGVPQDGPVPPIETPANAVQTLEATYRKPYHMHAALGPAAAAALWQDEHLNVWSHTQGVYPLRGSLASALDLDDNQVRVQHLEGPGCYGHNGADDVALDAALLARARPGRPVLLKWSRADEHGWEAYGSAMLVKTQASLDEHGQICDWNHDAWSYTHSSRPRPMAGASNLLAARYREKPLPPPTPKPGKGSHGGIHRNADPLYAFARRRVVKHFVPDSPLHTSALRGLGAVGNVFAIESFMDELATAIKADPIEFRLRHLDDPRARAVIEAAAQEANWRSGRRGNGQGRGQGLGFAQYKNAKCYVAVVFDVEVDTASGQIHLTNTAIAGDAGQIINPDGLANQLEGGVLQAASWTLKEQVHYGPDGVASRDWDTYPVLRFAEIPPVSVKLLDQPGAPSLGSGEATQGPTPAAIANAVFDAVGVRLREMPFTPERVKAALTQPQ